MRRPGCRRGGSGSSSRTQPSPGEQGGEGARSFQSTPTRDGRPPPTAPSNQGGSHSAQNGCLRVGVSG